MQTLGWNSGNEDDLADGSKRSNSVTGAGINSLSKLSAMTLTRSHNNTSLKKELRRFKDGGVLLIFLV